MRRDLVAEVVWEIQSARSSLCRIPFISQLYQGYKLLRNYLTAVLGLRNKKVVLALVMDLHWLIKMLKMILKSFIRRHLLGSV